MENSVSKRDEADDTSRIIFQIISRKRQTYAPLLWYTINGIKCKRGVSIGKRRKTLKSRVKKITHKLIRQLKKNATINSCLFFFSCG